MRMNKKKIISLALVISLIAILSFSSLAWFNDADEVTNEFRIASSEDPSDPDDIFSVDVWEPDTNPDRNGDGQVDSDFDSDGDGNLDKEYDQDGDGKIDTDYDRNNDGKIDAAFDSNGDGKVDDKFKDQDGLEFENILPGSVYDKEPTVENTGAYDQFVRVKVTVGDAAAWKELLKKHNITDLSTIFLGHNESDWIHLGEHEERNTITYTYYLQKILKPGEKAVLLTDVKIPEQFTQEDMAKFGGDFKIKIVAEAVQTENVGPNALEAFKTVMGG